jgi:hypothetical protein
MNGEARKAMSDPTTCYEIEVRGEVDVEWLRSFNVSEQVLADEAWQREGLTVVRVNTDQSGLVGLLRTLHGVGVKILQVRIVAGKE